MLMIELWANYFEVALVGFISLKASLCLLSIRISLFYSIFSQLYLENERKACWCHYIVRLSVTRLHLKTEVKQRVNKLTS